MRFNNKWILLELLYALEQWVCQRLASLQLKPLPKSKLQRQILSYLLQNQWTSSEWNKYNWVLITYLAHSVRKSLTLFTGSFTYMAKDTKNVSELTPSPIDWSLLPTATHLIILGWSSISKLGVRMTWQQIYDHWSLNENGVLYCHLQWSTTFHFGIA